MVDAEFHSYQMRCNKLLGELLAAGDDILHQAMRYSVLGGGKRLRPLLVYATGEAVAADREKLDNAAVAVELIHAYSLIHDDLPAMDNAPLRHGQLSCHQRFNEATAILAGDALQSLAFEVLANNHEIEQIKVFASAIGPQGVALGQSFDLQAEQQIVSLERLQQIHRLKTGALITASVQIAALCGNSNQHLYQQLTEFSQVLGLAFQIQDDILDVEANVEKLGKIPGHDQAQHKSTYVSALGLAGAKAELDRVYQQIKISWKKIPNAALLGKIARFIIERDY